MPLHEKTEALIGTVGLHVGGCVGCSANDT